MAKFCMKCGAKLADHDTLCPSCGQPVGKPAGVRPLQPNQQNVRPMAPNQNRMQQPAYAPQPQRAGGPNWTAIVGIIAVAVVAIAGLFFYYNSTKQEAAQPVQTTQTADSSSGDTQKKDNPAPAAKSQDNADTHLQTIHNAYISSTSTLLSQGEQDLANLAAAINSGSYTHASLLDREAQVASSIRRRQADAGRLEQPEAGTVNAANNLFDIQLRRAECMARGVRGDTNQFAVGGNYYDEFQAKFATFQKL